MTLRSDRLHVIGQTAIKIFMSRGAQPCAPTNVTYAIESQYFLVKTRSPLTPLKKGGIFAPLKRGLGDLQDLCSANREVLDRVPNSQTRTTTKAGREDRE
jgi:hypothetical protein